MEVLLVSRACRSRPMAVDLATPEISLPRAYYSTRSANAVGCEVLVRRSFVHMVRLSCNSGRESLDTELALSTSCVRSIASWAKKMYQRRKVVRLKPD